MEFRDLKKQYQLHKEEIDAAIGTVCEEANFISGMQVKEVEKKLAEYVGVKECISCGNGTDALQLALMAWNIGKGDAVFVPDFTFFSSGEVVPLLGATPIFVDVDEETYNISASSLEHAIEQVLRFTDLKPKAVVAVDLFGQPAEFGKIKELTQKYHLLLLEDGAQGFGGMIGEKRNCSFGDISTTSFFPAKPLGCYGDGGAIFTDNEEWAGLLRSLCVHGKGTDKYDNVRIGMNSRLDTLQASVLLQKLLFFEEEMEACQCVADAYTHRLAEYVKTPKVLEGMRSGWAQYTIRLSSLKQREEVMKALKEKGIPTAIYYKKPMHMQQAFQGMIPCNLQLTYANTEEICNTCLSLPMHAYLEEKEIDAACNAIKRTILEGN